MDRLLTNSPSRKGHIGIPTEIASASDDISIQDGLRNKALVGAVHSSHAAIAQLASVYSSIESSDPSCGLLETVVDSNSLCLDVATRIYHSRCFEDAVTEIALAELKQQHNYSPSLIFNADETSLLTTEIVTAYRIGLKTLKKTFVNPVHKILSCTLFFITCADGETFTTHIILPDRHYCEALQNYFPVYFRLYISDRGWMNKESLSLLRIDGHSSRRLPDLWRNVAAQGLDILCLPANTSSFLQPNDLYSNAYFKTETKSMPPFPSKSLRDTALVP